MSILSHPPHRLPTGSTPATTTNLTGPNRATLTHRPPLLSIPQVQPINCSTSSSPKSSAWSSSTCSPRSSKPVASAGGKRRKLRSTRSDSPSSAPPATATASRPGNKKPMHPQHEQYQCEPKFDSDDDDMPLLPRERLKLTPTFLPEPPVIPAHIVVPRSECCYLHTPLVQPSYETPHESRRDTHTCIRATINPYSVSISSQPPAHFSKTFPKLAKLQKSNPLSMTTPESTQNLLEAKRSEEQDKWWYWAKNCRITGDGNKSSHLIPLRCRNLKRQCDSYDDEHNDGTNLARNDYIRTRPLSESTLDQQKYYYSA